jgi:hypothetical protein
MVVEIFFGFPRYLRVNFWIVLQMMRSRLLTNMYPLTTVCNILSETASWSDLSISLAIIYRFINEQVLHSFFPHYPLVLLYKKLFFKQVASCSVSVRLPHSSRPSFILWPQFTMTRCSWLEEGVTWDCSLVPRVCPYGKEGTLRIFCCCLLYIHTACLRVKRRLL